MAAFVVLFVTLLPVVASQGLNCSSNGRECVQALRSFLTRTDWWFGDSYSSKCPDGTSETTFACMNPDRQHKSIISRILQTDSYDVNSITQLLHVRFYVPGGSYRACGHIFNVPAEYMDQDVDFSQPTGLDSWSLRNRPAITWNPEPGVVYALVAYSVDLLQLAGLWVNIMGGDSALGYELYPYSGPMYALNRTSFHAFLLLKQSNLISDWLFAGIATSIQDVMRNNSGVYRLGSLFSAVSQIQNLTGLGLIPVSADPYGIETHKSRNIYNSCPWLIARMRPLVKTVVAVQGLAAMGADVSNLEMEVEVSYRSDAISYMSCCKNVLTSQRTLNIDPVSMAAVNPVYLRSQPYVRFSAVDLMDNNFFFGKMFTLVLLDVTAATTLNSSRTSLQWLVVDIPGQYAASGVILKDYLMPLPPLDRNVSSMYMFFVFTQNDTLRNASWSSYCSNNMSGDCDFLVNKFAKDNNLHLSGINLFWSQPDLYSRMKMYENKSSMMDTACQGVSGYGQPCPDPCTTVTTKASTTVATATGDKGNGVTASITASDRNLLCLLFVFSVFVTNWRS